MNVHRSLQQKLILSCAVTLLFFGGAHPALAIVDLNGNGMSDIWEQLYLAGGLSPGVDSDFDGQTNLAESLAGTNPFDASSVLRQTQVGVASGNITLKWISVFGPRYQVQTSATLFAPNWQDLGPPFAGSGQEMTASFGQIVGEQQKYYRVAVSSLDSDNDGVTDWEEIAAGFNPNSAYTGGGTMDDLTRITTALQAATNTITVVASDPYATRMGGDTGAITITRTGRLDSVAVNYTVGGTAIAGTDYFPLNGTVTLPFGVNTVTLTVTPRSDAAPSVVARTIVLNLSAAAGYTIGTPASATVTLGAEAGPNSVLQEIWTNLTGYSGVAGIPVTTPPSTSRVLTTLEQPLNWGDYYGTRVRGYIVPPTTGNYTFWIASDDGSELWISSDDQPANLVKRASVLTYTGSRQWTKEVNQKSPILALTAGQKYYFEALQRDYAGGDNMAVGWFKPGDPGAGTAPSQVVPGSALAPYVPPAAPAAATTLYFTNLTPQTGVVSNGAGTSSLRLSADETFAIISTSYSGLTGPLSGAHIHGPADPGQAGGILFDIDQATPQSDGTLLWVFVPVGTNTVADIVNAIKSGRTYINLHTAAYPNGEIRGQYGLSAGTGNFTPPADPPAWIDDHADANGAARFLTQATFGPNVETIAQVQRDGYSAFVDQQLAAPVTLHLPYVDAYEAANPDMTRVDQTREAWLQAAVTGPDQLRQRVAFAFSEIFVVSAESGDLQNEPFGLAGYYDMLLNNAFGNFRQLLENVTLHPVMGVYLDMLLNDKPNPTTGTAPNENYAREVLQLFTIGLNKLNPDGTLLLDSQSRPIATYDQNVVVGLAHVFTGWGFTPASGAPQYYFYPMNYRAPMLAFPDHHDTGQKRVLDNVVLPAGQTQAQDLKDTLDIIFNHPNVGPFISRQLIQRLVTSNPSPAYVYRVARVFKDNGQGIRGDLRAVVRAILLDYEARNQTDPATNTFGHEREPVVRYVNLLRAFHAAAASGVYPFDYPQDSLGQLPLDAPTVFNFFEPNYVQPGAIALAGLVSPEFQITTDTTVVTSINYLRSLIYRTANPIYPENMVLNWTAAELALGNTPGSLVDLLNTRLMSGQLPAAMRSAIVTRLNSITVNAADPNPGLLSRARTAAYLIIASPQFNIAR
ncbi:MAG: DUF1800 family protein [Chthoniobacterales bacterium]